MVVVVVGIVMVGIVIVGLVFVVVVVGTVAPPTVVVKVDMGSHASIAVAILLSAVLNTIRIHTIRSLSRGA